MKKLLFISIICAFVIGCSSQSRKQLPQAKDEIGDTIFKTLYNVWEHDHRSQNQFIDWLNENGGYILALQYIQDSIEHNRTNDALAQKGVDIAWQHGYREQSLWFLQQQHPVTERDSVQQLFNELRLYLSQIHIWDENLAVAELERHLPLILNDSELHFKYVSDMGMHYHNLSKYDTAIILNTKAYNWAKTLKNNHSNIAMCCQRLGNDLNDLLRKHLVEPQQRKAIYERSASLYEECLVELNKMSPLPKERIANCYFTYGFLVRTGGYRKFDVSYYEKAIKTIVPNTDSRNNNDLIFCLHPLLASITYTHLGECFNSDFQNAKKTEYATKCLKYANECRTFFQQLLCNPDPQGIYNDLLNTYSQRNTNQLIGYSINTNPDIQAQQYDLLGFSTASKYALLNKQYAIAHDDSLTKVLSQIASLQSLQFVAFSTGNKTLEDLAKHLGKRVYRDSSCLTFLAPKINKQYIATIQKVCRKQNLAVVDLCLTSGYLLTTFIDKDTIANTYQPLDNTIFFHSELINEAANGNKVRLYDSLSNCYYRLLFSNFLDGKSYDKIVIVPTAGLHSTSFDAMTSSRSTTYSWDKLNYLGNKFKLQIIPRIDWVLSDTDKRRTPFNLHYCQVDFKGNRILPYSDQLKQVLLNDFNATEIQTDVIKHNDKFINGIIHIASHTDKDTTGSVNLLVGKTTINPINDKVLKCKMAVLNTCDASKGVFYINEGQISLARLFLSNGADAVVASTGKVDNHASVELFKQFYYYLHRGKSVSESLQQAKMDIRKMTPEWANPLYWAQYQLLGKDLIFSH